VQVGDIPVGGAKTIVYGSDPAIVMNMDEGLQVLPRLHTPRLHRQLASRGAELPLPVSRGHLRQDRTRNGRAAAGAAGAAGVHADGRQDRGGCIGD